MVTFNPQRTSQPYRQGLARQPSAPLSAMLAGRTLYGYNPQDQVRDAQRQLRLSQLAQLYLRR